jgi:hypothetical protein
MNAREPMISPQAGATLPEAVLSLAIMAIMAVGFGTAVSNSRGDLKLTGAASELATLRAAGDRYVQDNFQSLVASAAGGPVAVSVATLASQNYLPPSFPTMNSYGQTYQLYVRERSPTVLESVALTTGGVQMKPYEGGKIALLLKGSGGFAPVGSPTINGTNGGWSATLTTYVPGGSPSPSGNPAAYSIQYAVMGPTGALIRYATGNPADNQMTTTLAMNGNNITGVGSLNAAGVTANNMAVPAGGAYAMGASYLYGDNTNTIVRQNGGHYVQDLAGNTRWQVDGAGNSWQPGNVSAGSGNFNSSLATNGQFNANTVYANYVQSNGNMYAGGQFNSNTVYTNYLSLPGGNSLNIGGSTYYGDGTSNASRQWGGFYVQDPNGNNRWYVDGAGNTFQGGSTYTPWVRLQGGGVVFSDGTAQYTASSVPSGSICGLATNGGSAGYACQGYNSFYGCPPGYGQMYWRVNFGDNNVYYCFKI